MIVVVISDKHVLAGWSSKAAAEKWLARWLAESRDRWGWVVQAEVVCDACDVSVAEAPMKRKKRKDDLDDLDRRLVDLQASIVEE